MEEEIHYKVVLSAGEENVFYSSFASGKALVVYKTNVWTKAPEFLAKKGYHLCVFDKLNNFAYNWRTIHSIIFECLCKKRIEKLPKICYLSKLHDGEIWPAGSGGFSSGTLMFEEIKLLQRVPKETILEAVRRRY